MTREELTPSDEELRAIEREHTHDRNPIQFLRALADAGFAAGRAERDLAHTVAVDTLKADWSSERDRREAAEQKLAALVDGLRKFREDLADIETFSLVGEDDEPGDAALYRSQVTHLEDQLDALLHSADKP